MSIVATPSYSQVGVTAVPFLNIEPDARSSGLGFTGLTQVQGANSSFWNPSLLAIQENGIISLSHFNWLSNISSGIYYDQVSVSSKLTSKSGIAFDLSYFNLGDQRARDENGNDLGSFGNSEFALRVAYGHKLGENWSIGAATQYFRSSLAKGFDVGSDNISSASGLAIDLGGFFQKEINLIPLGKETFRFGYNLSSFGMGTQYYDDQTRQALPTKLRLGWSYELGTGDLYKHRFIFTNEFSKRLSRSEEQIENGVTTYVAMNPFSALVKSWAPIEVNLGSESATINTLQQLGVGLGAEYWFNNTIALRTGYFHENRYNGDRKLITLGTGLRVNRFGVDFSYMNSIQKRHPLDHTMKVTVLINFNTPNRRVVEDLYIPVVVETIPEAVFVKTTPVLAPMDTVYVYLSQGLENVQFPESESPATFIYSVDNTLIAEVYPGDKLQLKRIGMTRINLYQPETDYFTEASNHYVLVVLPDPVFAFESVNFAFDKDIIREVDVAKLDHVVSIMTRYSHVRVILQGHTDNFGPRGYNVDLSRRRSEAVKTYLVERGISDDRIEINWFAFDVPTVENNTRDNRLKNRRVEIIQIVSDQD
jgi:outer membrane protein OmpA-like peptidoglycan-associated protein